MQPSPALNDGRGRAHAQHVPGQPIWQARHGAPPHFMRDATAPPGQSFGNTFTQDDDDDDMAAGFVPVQRQDGQPQQVPPRRVSIVSPQDFISPPAHQHLPAPAGPPLPAHRAARPAPIRQGQLRMLGHGAGQPTDRLPDDAYELWELAEADHYHGVADTTCRFYDEPPVPAPRGLLVAIEVLPKSATSAFELDTVPFVSTGMVLGDDMCISLELHKLARVVKRHLKDGAGRRVVQYIDGDGWRLLIAGQRLDLQARRRVEKKRDAPPRLVTFSAQAGKNEYPAALLRNYHAACGSPRIKLVASLSKTRSELDHLLRAAPQHVGATDEGFVFLLGDISATASKLNDATLEKALAALKENQHHSVLMGTDAHPRVSMCVAMLKLLADKYSLKVLFGAGTQNNLHLRLVRVDGNALKFRVEVVGAAGALFCPATVTKLTERRATLQEAMNVSPAAARRALPNPSRAVCMFCAKEAKDNGTDWPKPLRLGTPNNLQKFKQHLRDAHEKKLAKSLADLGPAAVGSELKAMHDGIKVYIDSKLQKGSAYVFPEVPEEAVAADMIV